MNDLISDFIDKTLNDVSEMYSNDEFRDGYAEAVETIKNAFHDFFEETQPDVDCKVLEFDPDYNNTLDILEYMGEEVKGRTVKDYFTTSWNDSYFCILLLKKE